MRIEKINDNQIRCTLNKKDLSDRELRISELAYGTDKAKALFRDMVQQASYEFGFEAENIPVNSFFFKTLILIVLFQLCQLHYFPFLSQIILRENS